MNLREYGEKSLHLIKIEPLRDEKINIQWIGRDAVEILIFATKTRDIVGHTTEIKLAIIIEEVYDKRMDEGQIVARPVPDEKILEVEKTLLGRVEKKI